MGLKRDGWKTEFVRGLRVEQRVREGQGGGVKISNNIKYTHAARSNVVVITRLQLGKCKLHSYLYTINRHRDGLCSRLICNVPETIEHYLLECPNSPIPNAIKSVCKELSICSQH